MQSLIDTMLVYIKSSKLTTVPMKSEWNVDGAYGGLADDVNAVPHDLKKCCEGIVINDGLNDIIVRTFPFGNVVLIVNFHTDDFRLLVPSCLCSVVDMKSDVRYLFNYFFTISATKCGIDNLLEQWTAIDTSFDDKRKAEPKPPTIYKARSSKRVTAPIRWFVEHILKQ